MQFDLLIYCFLFFCNIFKTTLLFCVGTLGSAREMSSNRKEDSKCITGYGNILV